MSFSVLWHKIRQKIALIALFSVMTLSLSGCDLNGILKELSEFLFGADDNKVVTEEVSSPSTMAQTDDFLVTITSRGTLSLFKADPGVTELALLDQETEVGGVDTEIRPGVVAIRTIMGEPNVFVARGSVISRFKIAANALEPVTVIPVGVETQGMDLTPNGTKLYASSFTGKEVFVVDTSTNMVTQRVPIQGKALAVLVTNDGDLSDDDERVFVTHYISRLIDGKQNGFNDARQGIVSTFKVATPGVVTEIPLSPVTNVGFTKDLTAFCGVAGNDHPFCAPHVANLATAVEGGYPNFLRSLAATGDVMWVGLTVQSPEPPVNFSTNVQGYLYSINIDKLKEIAPRHFNLNVPVKTEVGVNLASTDSFSKLFMSDISSLHATIEDGQKVIYATIRNGNFVVRIPVDNGKIKLTAADIKRFPTGHMPEGVVFSTLNDLKRLYTYNDIGQSVTVIDPTLFVAGTEVDSILTLDEAAGTPPAVADGDDHKAEVGRLMWVNGLGFATADQDAVFTTEIRDLVLERGHSSDNNWSSCASCHGPDGMTDDTTWSFVTGPRQTRPLFGAVERFDQADPLSLGQIGGPATNLALPWGVMNWNGVRTTNTDFNNNSIGVQGGIGNQPVAIAIYNFGPNTHLAAGAVNGPASEALSSLNFFTERLVRVLDTPAQDAALVTAGREVFKDNCARCHGSGLWSIADMAWENSDPTFDADGGTLLESGLLISGGTETLTFGLDVLQYHFDGTLVGNFDATDPRQVRGTGGAIGTVALSRFNAPSLLNTCQEFWMHNGDAASLEEMLEIHTDDGTGDPFSVILSGVEQAQLIAFLKSINATTEPVNEDGAMTTVPNVLFRTNTGCPSACAP